MIVKTILYDALYLFINYIVAYIPFWTIRKFFYKLCGMKIGHGSRINMKCFIFDPWNIKIGKGTIINEFSLLDGRGGLKIGDNCSISMYSIIYTASHKTHSESFEYYERSTVLKDGVWIGARAIILPGATLENYCVIGAGSVARAEEFSEKSIYMGVPAVKIGDRSVDTIKDLKHNMFFR